MAGFVSMWLSQASMLSVGGLVIGTLIVAFIVGSIIRRLTRPGSDTGKGETNGANYDFLVSALLGLLSLLLAFTFGVALNYHEQRRLLVIEEANAIGTSYLRTQLLDEPYRTRISKILVAYTENRLEFGSQQIPQRRLLVINDRLLQDLWVEVVASANSAQSRGLTVPITQSFNQLIDLDLERKAARQARVPDEVFVALYIYLIATGCVLGYLVEGRRGKAISMVLFVLVALTMTVVVDLNHPTSGWIRESQQPMMILRDTLSATPPSFFGEPAAGHSK